MVRVLHGVESLRSRAGSVDATLRGLFPVLSGFGITSSVLVGEDAADGNAADGTFDAACIHRLVDGGLQEVVGSADLICLHGYSPELARAVSKAARSQGVPYVIVPRGALSHHANEQPGFRERFDVWRHDRKVLGNCSGFGVMNKVEGAGLVRDWSVDAEKCEVLPCGIHAGACRDVASAGCAERDDEARRILFLGPMSPVEGLVPMLMAVAELGRDVAGWQVVIAGDEDAVFTPQIEAAIRRKGGGDRVTFIRQPGMDEQMAELSRAAVLISPSLRLRVPSSVLWGCAAGVPVVATDHGIPAALHEAVAMCNPDQCALGDALRSVVRMSDGERLAMGEAGRKVVVEQLAWDVVGERFATFLSKHARAVVSRA